MALIWRPFHRALHGSTPGTRSRPTARKSVRSHRASSGGPAHGLDMTHTFMRSPLTARVWAFAWSAIVASALGCSSEQSAGPTTVAVGDSIPDTDSGPASDTLAA